GGDVSFQLKYPHPAGDAHDEDGESQVSGPSEGHLLVDDPAEDTFDGRREPAGDHQRDGGRDQEGDDEQRDEHGAPGAGADTARPIPGPRCTAAPRQWVQGSCLLGGGLSRGERASVASAAEPETRPEDENAAVTPADRADRPESGRGGGS